MALADLMRFLKLCSWQFYVLRSKMPSPEVQYNSINYMDRKFCLLQERAAAIRTLGPALAVLAEVVPLLVCADTIAADSPSPSTSQDDLAIVNTADELLEAVNDDGIRHVVIRSHMNITSPNSSSSAHLRAALLRLPLSTKHIQVLCLCIGPRIRQSDRQ